MQGSRPGSTLPCPAGRSVLVAEDRSAEGVRDPTRPEELPRRIRGLAHETVVTEDGPYPLDELGAVASTCEVVVLTGRATRVPEAAGTSGIKRTVTVTRRGSLSGPLTPDLGWGRRPRLHGMQGVTWTRRSRLSCPSGVRAPAIAATGGSPQRQADDPARPVAAPRRQPVGRRWRPLGRSVVLPGRMGWPGRMVSRFRPAWIAAQGSRFIPLVVRRHPIPQPGQTTTGRSHQPVWRLRSCGRSSLAWGAGSRS